jgi:hypothetical protein
MQSGKLKRIAKVVLALAIIVTGLWGIPHMMETPGRSLVQATASWLARNPYLFPQEGEPLSVIVENALQKGGGQIDRDGLSGIITEIIRNYRPDFQGDTLNLAVTLATNLVLNQLPASVADDRVLTPLLTLTVPRAIAMLPAAKVPKRYPDLTTNLFKESTWRWITGTAFVLGFAALLWATTRRIASPQDEANRTRVVNFLVTWPGLIVSLVLLGVYLYPLLMSATTRNALFASTSAYTATLFICGFFLILASMTYVLLALGITLLPYFAERVSILAVWRRLFIPPMINWAGNFLHQLQMDAIVKRVFKILFDHFAEEPAK